MVGVFGVVMGVIFLYIYICFVIFILGMRWVMIFLGILLIVMCLVLWFVIKDVDIKEEREEVGEKMFVGDFIIVLKLLNIWLVGISIFCVYLFIVIMFYFILYIIFVFGGFVVLFGVLVIIR